MPTPSLVGCPNNSINPMIVGETIEEPVQRDSDTESEDSEDETDDSDESEESEDESVEVTSVQSVHEIDDHVV